MLGDRVDVVENLLRLPGAEYPRDQQGGVTSHGFSLQWSTSLSINSPIFRGPSANARSFSAVALATRTVIETRSGRGLRPALSLLPLRCRRI